MAFTITKSKIETTDAPMTEQQIVTALEDTYQSCAHDVPGEWCGSDVLDFVVSTIGQYTDEWSNAAFWNTDRATINKAVRTFNDRYGMTE